jgi:hypothetical protein
MKFHNNNWKSKKIKRQKQDLPDNFLQILKNVDAITHSENYSEI